MFGFYSTTNHHVTGSSWWFTLGLKDIPILINFFKLDYAVHLTPIHLVGDWFQSRGMALMDKLSPYHLISPMCRRRLEKFIDQHTPPFCGSSSRLLLNQAARGMDQINIFEFPNPDQFNICAINKAIWITLRKRSKRFYTEAVLDGQQRRGIS